jgi:hypothetical protein
MPILMTEELVSASEVVEAGWTKFEILGERTQKATKGENVTNVFVQMKALDGPGNQSSNKNRTYDYMISGAGLKAKVSDVISGILDLMAAANSVSKDEAKKMLGNIDFNNYAGRTIWAEVIDAPSPESGKMYKRLVRFAPGDVDPR